jgi:CRISPR-associated protein Cmr5
MYKKGALMPDLDRGRAANAHACVNTWLHGDRNKYKSYAQQLPLMIRTNGLLPTLAFYRAKDSEHQTIASACEAWLQRSVMGDLAPHAHQNGINWLLEADTYLYRLAMLEAESWARWVKRFAEDLLSD